MPISASRSYSLSVVRGLTAREVSRLKKAGVDSTFELLEAADTRYAERKLARNAGVGLDRMREAVNRADLMRVYGMGAARSDLFENAGVNSVKELAQRNAASLAKILARYVESHPELNYRLPSPTTVASLVAKAKELVDGAPAPAPAPAPTPVTRGEATAKAEAGMHRYIDDVLFSTDPEGEGFRQALLDYIPTSGWNQVKAGMHAGVHDFIHEERSATNSHHEGVYETEEAYTFAGRLYGLYSEITIAKATGEVTRAYVEID